MGSILKIRQTVIYWFDAYLANLRNMHFQEKLTIQIFGRWRLCKIALIRIL